MKIVRNERKKTLGDLIAGDVFSYLKDMRNNEPNIYLKLDFDSIFSFTHGQRIIIDYDDKDIPIHHYESPALDLRNQ